MTFERTSGGELTQLVPDHVFRNENRHMLESVMDRKRVTDHVGNDRGASAPSLDYPLFVLAVEIVDLLYQMVVDKISFL